MNEWMNERMNRLLFSLVKHTIVMRINLLTVLDLKSLVSFLRSMLPIGGPPVFRCFSKMLIKIPKLFFLILMEKDRKALLKLIWQANFCWSIYTLLSFQPKFYPRFQQPGQKAQWVVKGKKPCVEKQNFTIFCFCKKLVWLTWNLLKIVWTFIE